MRSFIRIGWIVLIFWAAWPISASAQSANDVFNLLDRVLRRIPDAGDQPPPADQTVRQPDRRVAPAEPAQRYQAPRYTRADVRETQRILNELGYDAGPVDGAYGRRTRGALIAFQQDEGLAVNGEISDRVLTRLRRLETEGAPAIAQGGCTPIRFARGTSAAEITGIAPADGLLCYTLETLNGQTASIEVIEGANVIFLVPGLFDAANRYEFTTEQKTYEIMVGQMMRAVVGVPFRIRLSVTGAAREAGGEAKGVESGAGMAIAGVYCQRDGAHKLAIRETAGGGIEFAITSWQGGGHHCGASGRARPSPTGWRYEANMSGAGHERCAINFAYDHGVTLSVDRDARCRSQCGARATLDGLLFPESSRLGRLAAPSIFENPEFYNNVACNRNSLTISAAPVPRPRVASGTAGLPDMAAPRAALANSAPADGGPAEGLGAGSAQERDLAYIALRNAAQVAVVDLDTGSIVERIPVGPLPRATTASADGRLVAVVNDGDLTISLIDTGTNTVVETLDYRRLWSLAIADGGDAGPSQGDAGNEGADHGAALEIGNVVLGPTGARVYVAARWFGVMSVDRSSGKVVVVGDGRGGAKMIGPTGGVLKLSPDGSKLFMPNFSLQGLSIIDTERMMLVGSMPGLVHSAFDNSDDGRFVASFYQEIEIGDLETFEVRRLTDDNRLRSFLGGSLDNMLDPVEISPDGSRLYALRRVSLSPTGARRDVYQIIAFDLSSGARLGEVTVGDKPTSGMALTRDGRRIVIASPSTNTLHVYDALSLSEIKVIKVGPTPMAYTDFIVSDGIAVEPAPELVNEAAASEAPTANSGGGAAAGSKAADYLVREQIADACSGSGGNIEPSAVIERDLTGDGKADLIISHEGIRCANGGRSGFCGAQVCLFNVYIRRGALLKLKLELLGTTVTIGDGQIPTIRWHGHGGAPYSLKWNGSEFH